MSLKVKSSFFPILHNKTINPNAWPNNKATTNPAMAKGVKGFGLVSTIVVIVFMVVWYLFFNQIAFFSMIPP